MTDIFVKKKNLVKRAGRHFGFFKRAGRHEKGAGRHALQKKPRQNTAVCAINLVNCLLNSGSKISECIIIVGPTVIGMISANDRYHQYIERNMKVCQMFSLNYRKGIAHVQYRP